MYGQKEFERGRKALKEARSSVRKLIIRRNGVKVSEILTPGDNSKRRKQELEDLKSAAGELRGLALSILNDPFDEEIDEEMRYKIDGE